jgi:hypothetical protein
MQHNQDSEPNSQLSTEALIALIRPFIEPGPMRRGNHMLILLSAEHFENVRALWEEIMGELSKESLKMGEPIPQLSTPDQF